LDRAYACPCSMNPNWLRNVWAIELTWKSCDEVTAVSLSRDEVTAVSRDEGRHWKGWKNGKVERHEKRWYWRAAAWQKRGRYWKEQREKERHWKALAHGTLSHGGEGHGSMEHRSRPTQGYLQPSKCQNRGR
jgi:hypothetical protein